MLIRLSPVAVTFGPDPWISECLTAAGPPSMRKCLGEVGRPSNEAIIQRPQSLMAPV